MHKKKLTELTQLLLKGGLIISREKEVSKPTGPDGMIVLLCGWIKGMLIIQTDFQWGPYICMNLIHNIMAIKQRYRATGTGF